MSKRKPADRRAFLSGADAVRSRRERNPDRRRGHADWFDDGFLSDANAALQTAGKPGKLQLAAERRKGCAGVVLSHNGAEVRITFDALVEEARAELEQAAAQTLFT